MAWLLLVLFMPYLGVPLYLMFGGRKLNRMRRKARVYDRSQSQQPSLADRNTERFLLSYGVPRATPGNLVKFLTEGDQAFQRLVEVIDELGPQFTSLHIFLAGDVGKEILADWRAGCCRRHRPAAAGRCGIVAAPGGTWPC